MKTLRLLVLVLLAALLPLRGWAAAGVACAPQPASGTTALSSDPASPPDATAVPAACDPHRDHAHSGFDKERHCQSACSVAPLVTAQPALDGPVLSGAVVFARFTAPAPTFLSGGPERPPRSRRA